MPMPTSTTRRSFYSSNASVYDRNSQGRHVSSRHGSYRPSTTDRFRASSEEYSGGYGGYAGQNSNMYSV